MGKGQGKKGHKDDKAKARSEKQAKAALFSKSLKPHKKEKIKKVKKPNLNPPGPADFPIPMGRPKPFTKSPQHAKWPSMFKKHLGVIEAHIRNLDRVMQSMKSEMVGMSEEEKVAWELGDKGGWRTICEMMDRAREVLAGAREAARGILPARSLKDKKGLGVAGTNFEPLGPKLAERAAALGLDRQGFVSPANNLDKDGDTEMSDSSSGDSSDTDSSSSSSDSDDDGDEESSALVNKKRKASIVEVEANPYFVVDTKPTPVILNGITSEKAAKRAKKEKKEKKESKPVEVVEVAEIVVTAEAPVDFTAVEAQLQAEVTAGLQAQQEAEVEVAAKKEKKDKKRKRSSIGVGVEEVIEKKSKTDELAEGSEGKVEVEVEAEEETSEKKAKKEKKEKKDKKRKANVDTEEVEAPVEEGKKNKRKQRAEA